MVVKVLIVDVNSMLRGIYVLIGNFTNPWEF